MKKLTTPCIRILALSLACGTALAEGVSEVPEQIASVDSTMRLLPESPASTTVSIAIRDELPSIATVDLTAAPDDLLQRIRNGFAMPDLDSDLVTSHQIAYLNRPENLKRMFERSRRYLHFIVEEIEKRGLPTELALLPMVESAYNPMAYSPARAAGLWQFIPSTGRSYGLEQNAWIDERRDVIASTGAALDYLQSIYEMHGDWHLALASYNWGENAVARAISRNQSVGKPTDYLSLSMPAETRNYVPKLQALKNILGQPELFGIALDPIPNRPYFATVRKPADMDFALAAKLAEVPLDEFRALNPAHNKPIIKATGEASLVLPADKVDTFRSNLESNDKPLVSWRSYTLQDREKLDHVAARFGLSSARLREANGIAANSKLPAGYTLLVPPRTSTETITAPVAPVQWVTRTPKAKTLNARKSNSAKHVVASNGGRKRVVIAARSAIKAVAQVAEKPGSSPIITASYKRSPY